MSYRPILFGMSRDAKFIADCQAKKQDGVKDVPIPYLARLKQNACTVFAA
jgi:hypothetical protein